MILTDPIYSVTTYQWIVLVAVAMMGLLAVFFSAVRSAVGYTLCLIWLCALYFSTTWLAVGALSSMQFRADVKQKSDQEDVGKILVLSIQVDRQSQDRIKDFTRREELIRDAENGMKNYRDQLSKVKSDLVQAADQIGIMADDAMNQGIWNSKCREIPSIESTKINHPCQVKTKLIGQAVVSATFVTELDQQLIRMRSSLNLERKEFNDSLLTVWPMAVEKAQLPETVVDLKNRLVFMSDWYYSSLLIMPDQVLTLLLAIAMGALGSTITMTWRFLTDETVPPLRWYLMRPLVGCVSALVIFVFAKAGQMALTADGSDAELDPFFLSFVGLVAGLLSDRAYSQMESVGGRFLGRVDVQPDRWASGLQVKLNALTDEEKIRLSQHTGIDIRNWKEIELLNEAVPYQGQRRIADYFHEPLYLLFSDTKET